MVAPTNPATSASESASPDLWAGGLSGGLVYNGQVFDAFHNSAASLVASPSVVSTADGEALRLNYGSRQGQTIDVPYVNLDGLSACSYWIYAAFTGDPAGGMNALGGMFGNVQGSYDANAKRMLFEYIPSSNTLKFIGVSGSPPASSTATYGVTLNSQPHVLAFDWDGTTLTIYYDGAAVATGSFAGQLPSTATTKHPEIMGGYNVTADSAEGGQSSSPQFDLYAWGMNSSALGAQAHADIAADPYAAFRQPVADTAIQPDEFQDGQIFQRQNGSADVLFTGTTGSDVEVRVVDSGTSTPVVDWTPLTVTGTTYSGTLTVPEGGWYNTQVRHVDGLSETDSTVDWGVGIIVGVTGQSNVEHWWAGYWTDTSTADTGAAPNGHVRSYQGGTWSTFELYGNGAIAFANEVYNNLSAPVPVGLINRAVGGSALTKAAESYENPQTPYKGWWLNTASGGDYDNFITDVASLGGSIEQIIWQQGERDAKAGISKTNYYSGLETLFGRFRNDCGNASTSANLPILIGPIGLGVPPEYNESKYEQIRNAQKQAANDIAGVTLGPNKIDLPSISSSNPHLTPEGFSTMGQRYARVSLQMLGESAGYGNPTVSSIDHVSATQSRVNIQHGGGTDFTPTTGIQGFTVTDAGASVAVSDASRETATSILVTHAAASNDRAVSYEYTDSLDITAPFADNAPVSFDLMFYQPDPLAGLANPGLWAGAQFAYIGKPTTDEFGLTTVASNSGVTAGTNDTGDTAIFNGNSVVQLDQQVLAGATDATILAVITPSAINGNNEIIAAGSAYGGGEHYWSLFADNNAGNGGTTNCISFDCDVGNTSSSCRLESNTNTLAVGRTSVVIVRTSTTALPEIWIDGSDQTNFRLSNTGVPLGSQTNLRLGGGGLGNYSGSSNILSGWNRYLTDAEMQQLSADPFAAFEKKAAGIAANLNAGGSAYSRFSVIARAPGHITESASAADNDNDTSVAQGSMQSNSQAIETTHAMGQAASALLAGIEANEQWTAQVHAVVQMESGARFSMDLMNSADKAMRSAIAANTTASNQFMAAVGSVSTLTESAMLISAFFVTTNAMASIGGQANLSDSWSVKAVIAAVTRTVSAGVIASARFTARRPGARGYLTVGAITITAALEASLSIKPD